MKRYELTFDRKTGICTPREKEDGRFMLAEEVDAQIKTLEAVVKAARDFVNMEGGNGEQRFSRLSKAIDALDTLKREAP